MASTFTTNKNIEKPAAGDYNNAWATPVNADWDDIDTAFGGVTSIVVTGVTGTTALTVSQYRPPNIIFSGTMGTNINYQLPTGVGGIWTIYNSTTGSFSLTFSVSGGGSVVVPQGQRSLIVSDGTNVSFAFSGPLSAAVTAAENRGNTVMTNSTYLAIPLVNTGIYELSFVLGFNAPNSGGMNFNINYSGSFAQSGFIAYGATGSVGFVSAVVGTVQSTVTAVQYTIPGTGAVQALNIQGSINVSGAGTLAFSFAQSTSSITPTVLAVGSYEKITPIKGF